MAATPSTKARTSDSALRYVPALDGIRGLAVAAVLVFHGGFAWGSGGFLGVSTFFVLSGFLITFLLLTEYESTGRIRILVFWGRRFRRLMPAALFCLTGVAVFGAFVAEDQQLWRLRNDGLSALFYVANWRFLLSGQSYESLFGAPSPVQHFWSLAIEEQFYLIYPPLLFGVLAWGRGSRTVLWVAVGALAAVSTGVMIALHVPGQATSRVYYGTDTRAAELLVGALLALWLRRWPGEARERGPAYRQVLGFAGLGFSAVLWVVATTESGWLFEGGLLLYAVATAALIAASLEPGPLSRLLGAPPLRLLGRISYGVYLYHWPIFLWLTPETSGLDGAELFAVRLAATGVVSTGSFFWIERPIRSGRLRQSARVWRLAPIAIAGVAAALVGVTRDLPVHVSNAYGPHAPMPEIEQGAGRNPRILVVGDSIAYSLGRGLETWGQRSGRASVWSQAVYGCGIARGGSLRFITELDPAAKELIEHARRAATHSRATCDAWADWWPLLIERFDPDLVVVASGIWDVVDRKLPNGSRFRIPGDPVFDAWLLAEYQAAADVLSAGGAQVIWLTHPCIQPKVRAGPLGPKGGASDERLRDLNARILPELARSREPVSLLDLSGRVCTGGEFRTNLGEFENARPDGIHFSQPANRLLAQWIGRQVLSRPRGAESRARR